MLPNPDDAPYTQQRRLSQGANPYTDSPKMQAIQRIVQPSAPQVQTPYRPPADMPRTPTQRPFQRYGQPGSPGYLNPNLRPPQPQVGPPRNADDDAKIGVRPAPLLPGGGAPGPFGRIAQGAMAVGLGVNKQPALLNSQPGQMIQQMYRDYLGREGSPEEILSHLGNTNLPNVQHAMLNIANSPEAQAFAARGAQPAPQAQQNAAPQARFNMLGFDANKMASGRDTPKYQIGRVLQQFDPRQGITPEVLQALNALGIGTFSGERDKLRVSGNMDPRFEGNTNLDVIQGFSTGNPGGWQYLASGAAPQGGAPMGNIPGNIPGGIGGIPPYLAAQLGLQGGAGNDIIQYLLKQLAINNVIGQA